MNLLRDDSKGFTLVELLVVLVIIGLVSAAVILGMPDPRGALRGEALRLAARADAARERAMMDNRPVALVLKDGGYGFEWRTGGEWREMGERPFIEQSWSEGTQAMMDNRPVALVLREGGYAFEWRKEGEWRPIGERPFIEQAWSDGTRAAIEGGESRIVFDSTGFAEPARLRLARRGEEVLVEVTDGGRVHVVR